MRIKRQNRRSSRNDRFYVDIAEAAASTGVRGRVCGKSCSVKCARCGSTKCQCACSPTCLEAARALSSDPDRLPLEPAITPLVFEMKRLGMFDPCWSCEGHSLPSGALWKLPSVWFYCDSMTQIRLLANGLASLQFSGKLRAAWRVAVTFSDRDNPNTTFSIEPTLPADSKLLLNDLQSDVAAISGSLRAVIIGEAHKLLQNIPISQSPTTR